MRTYDRLFIGGEWVSATGASTIEVHSPATGDVVGRVPDGTTEDVDRAVAAARRAFDTTDWATRPPAERAEVIRRLFAAYGETAAEMAELIALEVGSVITFNHMLQVGAPTLALNVAAELAETYPFEEVRQGMMGSTLVRQEAVGVVAAIVPWNAPQLVAMTKIAPALAAGCAVVLKPAPEAPINAFLMAEVFERAGLPAGVVNVVPGGVEVGEHLVAHPGVDKVAFTGSTAVGRKIASLCGEHLKRLSLELGGKSAAIILDDADLDATMQGLRIASFMLNGEACVAQTRILAPLDRYEEVVDAVSELARSLKVGDPLDPATEVGPLISGRQRDRVESYIRLGQEEGAKIATGGGRPAGLDAGWYVEPTVFTNVANSMRIAREEIFGPVVGVIPYGGDDEAIAIANDSDYGLAGTVWTADPDRGLAVARRVRTGSYGINAYSPELNVPFGGFKQSGIGRENGPEGLREYLEYKSIGLDGGGQIL